MSRVARGGRLGACEPPWAPSSASGHGSLEAPARGATSVTWSGDSTVGAPGLRGRRRPTWRKYGGCPHLGGSAAASSPGRKCSGGLLTWSSLALGRGWAGRSGAGRAGARGLRGAREVPRVSGTAERGGEAWGRAGRCGGADRRRWPESETQTRRRRAVSLQPLGQVHLAPSPMSLGSCFLVALRFSRYADST